MGRAGTAEEMAAAVAFLASEEASTSQDKLYLLMVAWLSTLIFVKRGISLQCGRPNANKYPDFNWRKTMADLIVVGYEDEFKAEEVRN